MKFDTKNSIKQKFSVHFFIVAVSIAIGVYILLAENGKEYIVNSEILLLPKNEKVALQLDKVRENIVLIFHKSNKFEKIYEKENISLITKKENSFITVEVRSYNLEDSTKISKIASREVVNVASKYYNTKTELGIRIIDRKVSEKIKSNFFFILSISIAIGIISSFIIQFLIGIIEGSAVKFSKNKKKRINISRDIESMLMKNKSKIEELSYSPAKKEIVETASSEISSEEKIKMKPNFKKASSPQNLPIESFENLENDVLEDVDNQKFLEPEPDQDLTGEPAEEEYKERLNQLLRGK